MRDISALVNLAKSGDEAALSELFFRHESLLVRFAERNWNMGNDAEDAAQQVFMRLPGALLVYEHRSDSEFRSFLLTIAAQECDVQ